MKKYILGFALYLFLSPNTNAQCWSTISDGRVKKNIKDNVPGLAFINKLKAVTYNLDLGAADKLLGSPIQNKKRKRCSL